MVLSINELKESVCKANLDLVRHGLVILTFGNASGFLREKGLVVIKPSGVSYDNLKASDMVVVDLNGNIVEGDLNPSSDTPTHIEIYKSYPDVKGVVHTHSSWATIWAQAGKSIPAQGTTHADHFYGDIPCTRLMNPDEIKSGYEKNTGKVIVECLGDTNPLEMPAVLVNNHGPFTFGKDVESAVINAVALEEIAKTAYHTHQLGNTAPINKDLLNKHFQRKHGPGKYYGQK